MGSNIQRLGDTLAGRMKKTAGAAIRTTVELGVINRNMSLTTDSMRSPIHKGDYMVNLILAGGSYRTTEAHPPGDDEEHDHDLPDNFRALRAGDRVLVAWCGNEPVVLAIVVNS